MVVVYKARLTTIIKMSKENGSRDVSTINDTSIQSKIFVGIKSKVNDIPNMYRAYNLLGRTASLDE